MSGTFEHIVTRANSSHHKLIEQQNQIHMFSHLLII